MSNKAITNKPQRNRFNIVAAAKKEINQVMYPK